MRRTGAERTIDRMLIGVVATTLGFVACGGGDDSQPVSEIPRDRTATSTPDAVVEQAPDAGAGETPVFVGTQVSLTVTPRFENRQIVFDYVVANGAAEAKAVVDPTAVNHRGEPMGEGGVQLVYERGIATPGLSSPIAGLVVPPGGQVQGTVVDNAGWARVPERVQVCIEVVPPPWTDDGSGRTQLPDRTADTVPEIVCTVELPLPLS